MSRLGINSSADFQSASETLPEGWVNVLGEQLFEVVRGVTYGKGDVAEGPAEDRIAILRAGNIQDSRLNHDDLVYVPDTCVSDQQKLKAGDLVIAMSSGSKSLVGKVGFVERSESRMSFGAFCAVIRPLAVEHTDWLRWFFRTPDYRKYISEKSAGVNINNLKPSYLKEIPIALPPLAEQRRIVARLEALEARSRRARAKLAAVPTQLAQARQSLLAAAFRGELTADWREENQGYSAEIEMKTYLAHRFNRWIKTHPNRSPKNYKEPSLPALSTFDGRPNTWFLASPEQVASAEKYSLGIGPFGSDLKVSDYQDTGTPLIFVRDVKSGRFGGASSKYISPEKAADLQAHRVTAGDLLVTKMGEPPGDTSVYPENRPDGIITADCIRLRAEASITSGAYLCQALRSDFVRRQIDEISVGVAQQKVSLGRFATIGIPLPPLAEQHEIVRRLSAAFARLDAVATAQAAAVAAIDRLDQSLLARAFSGAL